MFPLCRSFSGRDHHRNGFVETAVCVGGEALTRALDGRQRDAETPCRLPQRGAWVNSLAIAASSQRGRPRVLPFSSARSAKTPTTPAEADHYDALGCVVEAAHLLGRAVADGIFGARVRQRAFRR